MSLPSTNQPSGTAPIDDATRARIAHLRALHRDALTRQAAADELAGRLAAAIEPDSDPDRAERLFAQARTAAAQAADAGDEAAAYAEQAAAILNRRPKPNPPAAPKRRAPATGLAAPSDTFKLPGTGGG